MPCTTAPSSCERTRSGLTTAPQSKAMSTRGIVSSPLASDRHLGDDRGVADEAAVRGDAEPAALRQLASPARLARRLLDHRAAARCRTDSAWDPRRRARRPTSRRHRSGAPARSARADSPWDRVPGPPPARPRSSGWRRRAGCWTPSGTSRPLCAPPLPDSRPGSWGWRRACRPAPMPSSNGISWLAPGTKIAAMVGATVRCSQADRLAIAVEARFQPLHRPVWKKLCCRSSSRVKVSFTGAAAHGMRADRRFAGEVGLRLAAEAAAQQQVVHGDLVDRHVEAFGDRSVRTASGSARCTRPRSLPARDAGGRRGGSIGACARCGT